MDYSNSNNSEQLRSILRSADRGSNGSGVMGRDRDRDRGRSRQGKESAVDDVELSELVSLISSLDATYRGPNTVPAITTTHSEEKKMTMKPMTDNLNDNSNNDVCVWTLVIIIHSVACFRCL